MRVSVLVLDDVFDTGLAAILDTLDTANGLLPELARERTPFAVRLVGVRRRARTHCGLGVTLQPFETAGRRRPDVVIVPALGAKMPGQLLEALERRDVRDAGSLLRASVRQGVLLGGACTATFVMGA